MCTAITFQANNTYFGRNLDYEQDFGQKIVITPRQFPFPFRKIHAHKQHYAMIGMGIVADQYPLYFDATNEYGLSMAGLNFPYFAVYHPYHPGKVNITPFEFIPYILGQCRSTEEAEERLTHINLYDMPFNTRYPLTPLHWIIADQTRSITVESTQEGIQCTDNPVGILTNSPPFAYHMHQLSCYMNLTNAEPTNRITGKLPLTAFSRGMGAYGLPGDLSSPSRFVRAAFTKWNATTFQTEEENISQFFHILDSVAQIHGCVKIGNDFERTIYSSCCNMDTQVYYYKTYHNPVPTGVSLHNENLNGGTVRVCPLTNTMQIRMEHPL